MPLIKISTKNPNSLLIKVETELQSTPLTRNKLQIII